MSSRKLASTGFLSLMVLTGFYQVASEAADCDFAYTSNTAERLIVPILKRKFGDAYIYFDFDAPVVFRRNGEVVVQLSATRVVAGNTLGFEDLFFVEIDPCSKSVSRYYVTQKYHK